MTEGNLLQYLDGVLRIELDLYVQRNSIETLTKQYRSLGIRSNIRVPQRGKPQTSLVNCMLGAGIVCGIIAGIKYLIDGWSIATGFFYYIAAIIAALICAVIGGLAGAVVLGTLFWCILRMREKRSLEKKFQADIAEYDAAVSKQNARLTRDNAKKRALEKEIAALRTCYNQSKNYLDKAYSCNIIDPEYRNIYAVSSFYGYIKKGRTHGLQFNQNTGDQGAYNIYENERRLDMIITNTDEILRNLDTVIQNQHELAVGLRNASRQINTLCGNVTAQLANISDSVASIERCQSAIAYYSECTARNMEFLSWVHMIGG